MAILDTSVISRYLMPAASDRFPALVKRVDELLIAGGAAVSLITVYELDRGLREMQYRGTRDRDKADLVDRFLRVLPILSLDANQGLGWKIAGELWARCRTHRPSITPDEGDLLIAACAGAHQHDIVTADKGFYEWMTAIELGMAIEFLPGKPDGSACISREMHWELEVIVATRLMSIAGVADVRLLDGKSGRLLYIVTRGQDFERDLLLVGALKGLDDEHGKGSIPLYVLTPSERANQIPREARSLRAPELG